MIQNLEERINTIQLPPSKPNPFETLTETEFDVMELLIRGCGNLEIAEIQDTSKNTVRTHIKHIYSKLGVLGNGRHGKDGKATILYMIYHPKSFLDSYTKEELENVKLIDDLTPRQLSVLEYYVMGFSYKKIADKLEISKRTVKELHLFNIFYKLSLKGKDIHKKNIKAMRSYILRYPKIIPSLYSQVKHLTANNGKGRSKKEIDIRPILSNITPNQDLTPRELEILDRLIEGGFNKEIAYRLFIDRATLRSHIRNINKKWHIALSGVGTHEGKAIRTARQQIYTKALEMHKRDIEPILSNITPSPDLTARELEVVYGVSKGESNEELAHRLFISKNTLRTHIQHINKKWDIKWEGVGTREALLIARQQTYTKALEMRNNSKES